MILSINIFLTVLILIMIICILVIYYIVGNAYKQSKRQGEIVRYKQIRIKKKWKLNSI